MSDSPNPNEDSLHQEPASASAHDAYGRTEWVLPPDADTGQDPPANEPAPRSRTRVWIAGGVAAAVLAVGGFFGVDAIASHTTSVASASARGGPGGGGFGGGGAFGGGGGFGGGGVFGTIKSISGSSFVVTTNSGSTETVTTTSDTTATKAVSGSLSDIKAGDHVVVMGTGTTTIAATSITDSGTNAVTAGPAGAAAGSAGQGGPPGPTASDGEARGAQSNGSRGPGGPPGAGMGLVSGTVTEVGSGTLTVTETGGTVVKVTTSSSTNVTTLQTISVSDLAVGQSVMVRGTTTNGTVSATAIEEGATAPGRSGQGGPPAAGQSPPTGA